MAKRDPMLKTIAEATAKTVSEVSKAYRKTEIAHEHTEDVEAEAESKRKKGFYPFGTPFQNIVQFTREVEVFTRHIDTFTRDRFGKESQNSSEKKK